MPNLYLFIDNFSDPYFALSGWLHANTSLLEENGLQFQAHKHPHSGLPDLARLARKLAKQPYPPGKLAASLMEDLARGVAKDRHLVWLISSLDFLELTNLRSCFTSHPVYARYTIQPVLMVQNQIPALRQWVARFWKKRPLEFYGKKILNTENASHHGAYLSTLQNLFGSENCHLLPFADDYNRFGRHIKNILELPPELPNPEQPIFPRSFAAMDMMFAASQFPFDLIASNARKRERFYKTLARVEKNEGYAIFNHLPQSAIQEISGEFAALNREFAATHGPEYDFLLTDNSIIPMPDTIPSLDETSCKLFVQSLDTDLRQDLTDFFHIKAPENAQEELLARTLEPCRPSLSHPVKAASQPVLSVLTMCHNQKDFIMQCMESVSEQKTDFPIEHIIVDDESMDGTQDIIDNYAATHSHVRPYYLGGLAPQNNVSRLFNLCKSPFAALCDGDDYFSSAHKLQSQVDFLEKNRDCALCFHPVAAIFEDGSHPNFVYPPTNMLPRGVREKYYLADMFKGNLIQTNSVVYRWRFRDGLPDWFRSDLCPADYYWHILHAEMGKIGFLREIMSVYRRHATSLYADAFLDTEKLRGRYGMAELETYNAINDHFNGRYFRPLSGLANGVFCSFLQIKLDSGDDALLEAASKKYPQFALRFFQNLKISRGHA